MKYKLHRQLKEMIGISIIHALLTGVLFGNMPILAWDAADQWQFPCIFVMWLIFFWFLFLIEWRFRKTVIEKKLMIRAFFIALAAVFISLPWYFLTADFINSSEDYLLIAYDTNVEVYIWGLAVITAFYFMTGKRKFCFSRKMILPLLVIASIIIVDYIVYHRNSIYLNTLMYPWPLLSNQVLGDSLAGIQNHCINKILIYGNISYPLLFVVYWYCLHCTDKEEKLIKSI